VTNVLHSESNHAHPQTTPQISFPSWSIPAKLPFNTHLSPRGCF